MSEIRPFSSVDFSMIDTPALVNLALQRGSNLKDILPARGKNTDWREDYAKALEEKRDTVLKRVWDEIAASYLTTRSAFVASRPWRVADIGCGQGLIDLMIQDDTGCDLVLIDIEETDDLYFGFKSGSGAGYASLNLAKTFLMANGVKESSIETVNPKHMDVSSIAPVDLSCSFISCGFHYPLATYQEFFQRQTRSAMVVDVRNRNLKEQAIDAYGRPFVIGEDPEGKWKRYFIKK